MKKVVNKVRASKSYLEGGYDRGYDHLHPYFDEIGTYAHNIGYDLSGTGIHPVFTWVKDDPLFPKLTVEVEEENGVYYFVPTVEMPTLKGNDTPYYDSFEYYADKYKDVAKLCTRLMEHPLNPSQWYNSKEEEEADYQD